MTAVQEATIALLIIGFLVLVAGIVTAIYKYRHRTRAYDMRWCWYIGATLLLLTIIVGAIGGINFGR